MNDTFTYFQKKGCTVFSFPGKTRVLSTSPLNGGITAHLTHALNINCMNGAYECEMLGNTYEEDLNIHTKELGIDPQTATALSTAAWTELCAVEKICYQELSVTAAVTGGIDSNGMCPGDPSSYYERNGAYEMLPPGTINVFILYQSECYRGSHGPLNDDCFGGKSSGRFTSLTWKLLFRRNRDRFWY